MVAKHVKADIVVTPSNDPRSYRINSDRLLATGFLPKKTVEDAIKEIIGMYSQGQLRTKTAGTISSGWKGIVVKMNPRAFSTPARLFGDYSSRLSTLLAGFDWAPVERLAYELLDCWQTGRQVFFAGKRRQRRQRQSPRQ